MNKKRLIIELIILGGLLILYFPTHLLMKHIDQQQPVPLAFHLSTNFFIDNYFDEELSSEIKIDKIYLSGDFNNWASNSKDYRLKAKDDYFSFNFEFLPGDHRMQYFIHLTNTGEYQPLESTISQRVIQSEAESFEVYTINQHSTTANMILLGLGVLIFLILLIEITAYLIKLLNWKKYLIRLGIIVLIIAIYIPLKNYLINLQKVNIKPVTFSFEEEDIPEYIKNNYGLNEPIEIESVIITGDFSAWSPADFNYEMQQVSSNRWEYEMQLNEGNNPYKYVLHIRNPDDHDMPHWSDWNGTNIVWVKDINAEYFEDDQFGDENSVIKINYYTQHIEVLNTIFILSIISIILWSILEILILLFMHLKLSLRFKLIISFILMIIISNFVFIYLSSFQINQSIINAQVDKINIIHNMLLKEEIDFSNLNSNQTIQKINSSLSNYYLYITPRYDYQTFGNNIDSMVGLALINTNGNLLSFNIDQITYGYEMTRWPDFETYLEYIERYIKQMFSQYTNDPIASAVKDIYYPKSYIDSKEIIENMANEDYAVYLWMVDELNRNALTFQLDKINPFIYSYDSYLYPIYYNNELSGYYSMRCYTEPYTLMKTQFITFNLIILALFLIIYLLINSQIGKFILNPLYKLIDWTQAIIRRDFKMVKTIQTNDEVELLANNFNTMRLSLKKSIDYLSLTSVIAANFQKINQTDELFYFFLGFVTSEFGFRFNRSAIFIQDDDNLICRYAIGLMDEEEAAEVFGSIDNYYAANIQLEDYIREYKSGNRNFESRFTQTIIDTGINLSEPSLIVQAYDKHETKIINFNNQPPLKEDQKLINLIGLQEFVVFTLYRGKQKIGILIVDNAIGKQPINREEIEHLEPVIQYFGTALEKTDLFEHMEQTIEIRTRELRSSNAILNIRNQEIMESIHYAQTIQQSILPPTELRKKLLTDHFIIWKPRDVVGGDFYYLKETYHGFILAVGDCTGHGVPGAFMTMTAYSVLNRIIEDIYQDDPAIILHAYNRYMREALNQDTEAALSDDGLDIGICLYIKDSNQLLFSGAKLDLWYLHKNQLQVIKGDRHSIGYQNSDPEYEFNSHSITLSPNDVFYLTTDGFYHQVGGVKKLPFGKIRLQNIFENELPDDLLSQKQKLEQILEEWQDGESQRDDITVWGFQFK